MSDRRKLHRFSLKLPAEVVVIGAGQEADITNLLTSDICAGGAFFETGQPLPEGTQVHVRLVLPVEGVKKLTGTHAHVKLRGTVKRSGPSGMAICFDEECQMMPFDGEKRPSREKAP